MSTPGLVILTRARALLQTPDAWTQKWCARDARGRRSASLDPDACKWCPVGAVVRAAGDLLGEDASHAWSEEEVPAVGRLARAIKDLHPKLASSALGPVCLVPSWNDAAERTHAEVLAVFDRAIELARVGGAS